MKPQEVKESAEYENCLDILGTALPKQSTLSQFLGEEEPDDTPDWKKHWVGMPEFNQEDNPPYKKLLISFRTEEDYQDFAKIIGQSLTEKTKSIWHPKLDRDENSLKRWIEE